MQMLDRLRRRVSVQKLSLRNYGMLAAFVTVAMVAGGCKKTVAVGHAPAPPPVTAPQPTVSISASPSSVKAGDTVTLSWQSTDATDADIEPGVGKVSPTGSTPVNPTTSTTYTITVTGTGGTATASARATVGAGAPMTTPTNNGNQSMSELFEQNVKDAYFDFNKAELRPDARDALSRTAEFLRSYPQVRVTIEGHCDDRGSTEYNIGLGERRAQSAKNYLISLGITPDRMDTVSWGKERPFCTEQTESCWQDNRRAHFVAGSK
jgi:peptidoglycan-associated lipoprotein